MGASAGVFGLVSFLAFSRPQLELNFLLFFFLPISIRLKTLLYSLATLSIGASAFYEVYGATAPFPYAPSAHLGGLIAGWLCFCFLNRQSAATLPPDLFADVDSDKPETSAPSAANVAVVSATAKRQAVRAEIDRILDKINSTGLKSLTPAERQILDQAKNHLPGN